MASFAGSGTPEARRTPPLEEIGIIARPEKIIISDALPKTRSGKIMRRILRSLACGEKISGDISTLEDSSVLAKLKEDA